jgi:N,N'-diacetylchitobiose transport system substrate-binding protein
LVYTTWTFRPSAGLGERARTVKGWRGLAAGAAALAVAVSGCGTSTNSGSTTETKEITVWLMDGSAAPTLTDALNKEFESANGIKVKYEVQ